MSKLFQIREEDLATLEHILPEVADRLMPTMDNRLRVQLRQAQQIITNVRWNYGPPSEIEIVEEEPEDDERD